MTSIDLSSLGRLVLAAPGVILQTGQAGTSGGSPGGGITGDGGPSRLGDIVLLAAPGQSNAGYSETEDGAFAAMAQATSFYLQATGSASCLSVWTNAGEPGTEVGGIGVMEISNASSYNGSFLSNIAGSSFSAATASAAPLGTCGIGYAAFIASLSGSQIRAVNALVQYWGETDSLEYTPADKPVYKAALINLLARVRGMLGVTAPQMPLIFFGPPYGLLPNWWTYPPALREVWAELEADPAQNFIWAVRQTYDTLSRQEVFDPITGVSSGGNVDGGHRSAADNLVLFKRAALPAARAILAANNLAAALIPASLGTGKGPQISEAVLAGNIVTLTVAHDGGDDLVVPLLANQGVGFSVMDGGSNSAPGAFIQATACIRTNNTTLQLTLVSSPSHPASACRLMYPWPGVYSAMQPDAEIGRGCAVTDNFSVIRKPDGFDINAGFGAGWAANMPLCTPVTVTGSGPSAVAEYGIALTS